MSTIDFWMCILGTIKLKLHLKIKRKPHLLVLLVLLNLGGCHLVYVMQLPLFKDAC